MLNKKLHPVKISGKVDVIDREPIHSMENGRYITIRTEGKKFDILDNTEDGLLKTLKGLYNKEHLKLEGNIFYHKYGASIKDVIGHIFEGPDMDINAGIYAFILTHKRLAPYYNVIEFERLRPDKKCS